MLIVWRYGDFLEEKRKDSFRILINLPNLLIKEKIKA